MQILPYGIGANNTMASLAIKGDASAVALGGTSANIDEASVVEIELRTLDGFFATFDGFVDLLFVNCEGCEYSVI